jgi:hypothetical protein
MPCVKWCAHDLCGAIHQSNTPGVDMTFEFKRVAAALAFAAVGAAHADVLVIKNGGATFTGIATLTLSTEMLGALDTGKASVANYGTVSTLATEKDTDGYYVSVASTSPMQTLTLDDESLAILGMGSTGGLTVTTPMLKSVTSGGSLSIIDISTDLSTKTVYATLIGANGVGTVTNVAMWTFDKIEGPTRFGDANPIVNDITGLSLTNDGWNKWVQALGLVQLGRTSMEGLDVFGSLHTVTSFSQICDGSYGAGCGGPTPSIPEPASHTLMALGLGLGVLGAMAARRKSA